jgi:hypothetical protein
MHECNVVVRLGSLKNFISKNCPNRKYKYLKNQKLFRITQFQAKNANFFKHFILPLKDKRNRKEEETNAEDNKKYFFRRTANFAI